MHRLRAGLPLSDAETGSWMDRPFSLQQLGALVQQEIDRGPNSTSHVLVFRTQHRPFGLIGDDSAQFGELRPELRDRLRSVHPKIRAVGSQGGEILGFAPVLERRTDAEDLLRAITASLSEPILVDGLRRLLGPRSGGVVLGDLATSVDELFSATKLALAQTGAAQSIAMYHPDQRAREQRTADLAQGLHQAVVDRTVSVRYQPDIHLHTGEVVAIKAYAHWQPAGGEVVSNDELFDAARRASLVVPIGREVIEAALNSVYGWITSGLLPRATVWVNVHPHEVLAPDFHSAMSKVIEFDSRLKVGLELTENPVEDQQYIYGVIGSLVANGATAAIGGFGTGHLNLADFRSLPFSAAKIDRALTRQMSEGNASSELVRAVAGLATLFGLDVTAHGIESIDQVNRLRHMGISTGQGFYFARPMAAEDMQELLVQVRMQKKSFL